MAHFARSRSLCSNCSNPAKFPTAPQSKHSTKRPFPVFRAVGISGAAMPRRSSPQLLGSGLDGSNALVTSAGSRTAGLTWTGTPVIGDTGAAISLKADSLVPAFVFARGSNLDTPSTPTYLAAVVTRGSRSSLRQVVNGIKHRPRFHRKPRFSLSLRSVGACLAGADRSSVCGAGRARDTGQYLNANGTWQNSATTVTHLDDDRYQLRTGYLESAAAALYSGCG